MYLLQEDKQRAKVKEKLDKCVKDKLMDFCDVLNIPISKSTVKKVIAELVLCYVVFIY